MSFYSEKVFPCICDLVLGRPFMAQYRREQLADVKGDVLEIGVGSGLNLPHYPPAVRSITTVEPNPGMNRRLAKHIQKTGIAIDSHTARGEHLPFAAETFDFVVSTLVLCSVAEVAGVIQEIYRVLKVGGQYVFFEHGLSPDAKVAARQRRWNWLQQRLADGCRLDLDVPEILCSQPFRQAEIDRFYLPKAPKTHGYIYRGAAVK